MNKLLQYYKDELQKLNYFINIQRLEKNLLYATLPNDDDYRNTPNLSFQMSLRSYSENDVVDMHPKPIFTPDLMKEVSFYSNQSNTSSNFRNVSHFLAQNSENINLLIPEVVYDDSEQVNTSFLRFTPQIQTEAPNFLNSSTTANYSDARCTQSLLSDDYSTDAIREELEVMSQVFSQVEDDDVFESFEMKHVIPIVKIIEGPNDRSISYGEEDLPKRGGTIINNINFEDEEINDFFIKCKNDNFNPEKEDEKEEGEKEKKDDETNESFITCESEFSKNVLLSVVPEDHVSSVYKNAKHPSVLRNYLDQAEEEEEKSPKLKFSTQHSDAVNKKLAAGKRFVKETGPTYDGNENKVASIGLSSASKLRCLDGSTSDSSTAHKEPSNLLPTETTQADDSVAYVGGDSKKTTTSPSTTVSNAAKKRNLSCSDDEDESKKPTDSPSTSAFNTAKKRHVSAYNTSSNTSVSQKEKHNEDIEKNNTR